MAFLINDFSEFLVFSSVIFLYVNKYFKWFWTEGVHIQFTVIMSLVVCGQTQEVNEIMRQTLIHGALNLERLGRHGTLNPERFVWSVRDGKGLTWLSQTNCGWWRKTTYTFEFSFKRIRYFSSCAKKKVKFCCPVKYVNIHIFSQLTWLSQTNCGWRRKTTCTFEFSVKRSIRIRYFSSCAQKKLNFVDQCYLSLTYASNKSIILKFRL